MAEWRYVAYTDAGERRTGVMEAADQVGVRRQLGESNLLAVKVEPNRPSIWHTDFDLGGMLGGVSNTELAFLFRQLSSVLRVGMPLTAALTMQRQSARNPRLKLLLNDLESSLRSGQTLWEAFAAQSGIIPQLYVDMVRAAERSGNTAQALERAAAHAERGASLRKKIRGALLYPAFVSVVAAGAIAALLLVVMPRMKEMMKTLNVPMPLPTKIMIGVSDFALHNWPVVLVGLILLVTAPMVIGRSDRGKAFLDRVRLRYPLLGKVYRAEAVAGFTRVLSEVMAVGMPMHESVRALESAWGNRYLQGRFAEVSLLMLAGEGYGRPLARVGLLPNEALQMIQIGEVSGNLSEVSAELARFYDGEANHALNVMVDMVQPVLMSVIGGIVLMVGLAIIMPLYTSYGSVQ